ncbi:hypothetical protein BT93_D0183 [Corymbia citriodora subsp. variegata]|nr:hypothetical protein BT93_D0183 [Corymbia citriodora subsp. variegata]
MKLGRSRARRRAKSFSGAAPSSSSSPRRPSLLSSWLLKLGKIGVSRPDRRRGRHDRALGQGSSSPAVTRHYNSPSEEVVSTPKGGGVEGEGEGRLLEGDGGFWRLSFRGERTFDAEGDSSGDLLGPIWCRSDGDKEAGDFEEMVSGVRRRRDRQRRSKSLPEIKVESAELKTPRRRKVKRERKFGIGSDEKVLEAKNQDRIPSNCSMSSRKPVGDSEFPLKSIPEMQRLDETSDDGDNTGGEKQRKSLYIRREPPRRGRVRVHSPRAASIEVRRPQSPVKEDAKEASSKSTRARTKTTKKGSAGDNAMANRLERFAVVKCSYDPQRDFRESMMEMIIERRIRRSKDMEELLACYLTLNSDEYHGLIIKVFRQVWFELNQACFDW